MYILLVKIQIIPHYLILIHAWGAKENSKSKICLRVAVDEEGLEPCHPPSLMVI